MLVRVLTGDATSEDILLHAGLRHARALIVTLPDPATVRTIVSLAKDLAPGVPVLVRARYNLYTGALLAAGADAAVDEEQLVGRQLADEALRTAVT